MENRLERSGRSRRKLMGRVKKCESTTVIISLQSTNPVQAETDMRRAVSTVPPRTTSFYMESMKVRISKDNELTRVSCNAFVPEPKGVRKLLRASMMFEEKKRAEKRGQQMGSGIWASYMSWDQPRVRVGGCIKGPRAQIWQSEKYPCDCNCTTGTAHYLS